MDCNTTGERLQKALALARLGFKIVILHGMNTDGSCTCGSPDHAPGGKYHKSRGKHPRHDKWGEIATSNEAIIQAWFQRWPNSNFGVKLGAESGIVDFEADNEAGEKLIAEMCGGEIPRTPAFSSGRGTHRLFKWREGLPLKASIALGDADLKLGAGKLASQSVFPPSQHYSGKTYTWLVSPDECEPAEIPDCAMQWIAKREATTNSNGNGVKVVFNDSPLESSPSVENVLRKIKRSKKAAKFSALFDVGNGGIDHSRDDMALCGMLAFYTGPDPALIDQIFRQSKLMRDKWDSRRGDSTYGRKTIEKILQGRNEFYDWNRKQKATTKTKPIEPMQEAKSEPQLDEQPPTENETQDAPAAFNYKLPQVWLPDGSVTISQCAGILAGLLAATEKFYIRGGVPMRSALDDHNHIKLEPLKSAAACSDFETVARLMKTKTKMSGEVVDVPAICHEAMARAIISANSFSESLPPIKVLSRCPVLVERGGKLETITGYDRQSGIWALGEAPVDVSLDEAREMFNTLLRDFQFADDGDKSRAIAAFITPELVLGDLLGGRAPIDVGEADESQSGKGYRTKLVTAIYRHHARTVTQRERGVGSMQESFDACLVGGSSFIVFDNLRGKNDCPWFESFMTEPTYSARVPYASPVEIDATRTIVLLTTNKAELTRDLANRSSVVRIRKRGDNHKYQSFPEGYLLEHVQANQPKYLGAVFAVIREWHRQGKPTTNNVAHDFRRWASVLGWIVENIFKAAPLTQGHREVQSRMTTPALTWLRDVAFAVKESGRAGDWLRPHNLLEIILDRGIETQGIPADIDTEDKSTFEKAVRALGKKLSHAFPKDETNIDGITIKRRTGIDKQYREIKEYAFFPVTPNDPQWHPESKHVNPESPECAQTLCKESADGVDSALKGYATIAGIAGFNTSNAGGGCANDGCDHSNPANLGFDSGKRYCTICGERVGNLRGVWKR